MKGAIGSDKSSGSSSSASVRIGSINASNRGDKRTSKAPNKKDVSKLMIKSPSSSDNSIDSHRSVQSIMFKKLGDEEASTTSKVSQAISKIYKMDSESKHLVRSEFVRNQTKYKEIQSIKRILQMDAPKRTDEDLDELVKLIKDVSFFKERKLSIQEIKEVASGFQFQEVEEGEDVVKYGDQGDNFYLII